MTESNAAKVGEVRSRALAELRPDSIDTEAGTVEAVFSTGEPRWMAGGTVKEQLRQAGADLSVANEGAPAFKDHRHSVDAMVGRIVPGSVRVEQGKIVGRVALNKDSDAWKLVKDGFLRQFSFGYRVDEVSEESNGDGTTTVTVTRWTPLEVSLVGLAAERGARVRSASDDAGQEQGDSPQSGVAHRLYMARKAADEGHDDLAQRAANANISGDDAARELLTRMEERSDATMTFPHVREGAQDAVENTRNAAIDALTSRLTGNDPQTSAGRDMRGYSLVGMARELMQQTGAPEASTMSDKQLASRALHSSSDFPTLLESTGQRVISQAYEASQSPLRMIARNVDASDFRPFSRIQMGEHPNLDEVREHGEFRRGSMESQSEQLQLKTFGKVFGLTRQAVINDDTGALAEWMANMAQAATALEADLLASVLTANSGAGERMSDGNNLFAGPHNNLASANALNVAGLDTARQMLRQQTAPGGDTPLSLSPQFLVVGSTDETTAEQVVTGITPNSVDQSNPFANRLTVATEPRLDPANSWYVFAAPSQSAVLAMVFLDGNRTPEVQTRQGFDVDGIEMRIRHDCNAGLLDYRGAVRTPKA